MVHIIYSKYISPRTISYKTYNKQTELKFSYTILISLFVFYFNDDDKES